MHGITKGMSHAIGMQSLCRDLGWQCKIRVHSDATAAIGIARRRGMGRIRHLDVMDLWVQEKFTTGATKIDKVLGAENPADILTKHVERKILEMALQKMGMSILSGRSDVAPQAMGVQNQLLNKPLRF